MEQDAEINNLAATKLASETVYICMNVKVCWSRVTSVLGPDIVSLCRVVTVPCRCTSLLQVVVSAPQFFQSY